MKKIKCLIATILLLLISLSLTACGDGAKVNTTLEISKNLDGVRNMQMVFAKSTFEDYFKGNIDDLNSTIDSNIPAAMSYEYTVENGYYYYQFMLPFTSVDDYLTKVNTITGSEQKVSISSPDSVWVSGIYVDESFSSPDLLRWLSSALVDNGLLSSSYVSNLFGDGKTKVVFSGEEIDTSKRISIDRIDYQKIDSIEVYTEAESLTSVNRTVRFNVPSSSMQNKGSEIDEYMNSVTPANASIDKSEVAEVTTYTYTGTGMDTSALNDFMKAIFGEENASVECVEVDDYYSPFTFSVLFIDRCKLNNFVIGNTYTQCDYYARALEDGLDVFRENVALGQYRDANDYYANGDYKSFGSMQYYGDDDSFIEIPLLIQKAYCVDNVDITSKKGRGDKWTRNIVFHFVSTPTDEEIDVIKSRIEAKGLASNATEKVQATKVSTSKGDAFTVNINQNGSMLTVQNDAEMIFGAKQHDVEYVSQSGLFAFNKYQYITDAINLGNYVESKSADYRINYVLDLGAFSKVIDCGADDNSYSFEGGKIKESFRGSRAQMEVLYQKTDVGAIGFVVFLILAILLLVLAIVKSNLVKSNSKEKVASDTTNEVVNNDEKTDEELIVCPSCGKRMTREAVFCSECGTKISVDKVEE